MDTRDVDTHHLPLPESAWVWKWLDSKDFSPVRLISDLLRTMIRDYLGHQRHTYVRSAPTPPDPHSQTMPKNWRLFPYDVKQQPSLSCLKVVLSQCLSSHVLSAATTFTFSCCYPFSRTHRRSLSQSTTSPFCLTRCMASLASFFKANLTVKILTLLLCSLLKFNKHLSAFPILKSSTSGKTPWKTATSVTLQNGLFTLPSVEH